MTKPTEPANAIQSSLEEADAALRVFVGYNMKRAFHTVQGDVTASLAPLGLRMLTFSALSVIVSNAGLRQSHLADALAIERPNLVLLVDELERADLITRDRAKDDRRAYSLNPTEKGIALCRRAEQTVLDHDRRMTRDLTPAERSGLIAALQSIENVLNREDRDD